MNEEKRRKAEMLLESIGEIDDGMLGEALDYRKKPHINTRVIALAASFAVIFALVAGSGLVKRFTDIFGGVGDENTASTDDQNGDENPTEDVHAKLTLESVFDKTALGEKHEYVTDPDELPYLDGMVYIVWKYTGEEKYYISDPLADGEFDTVKAALGKGKDTGIASPALNTSVWVLLGDGRVISPYLKASNGNISAEIFDYEVEIIPGEELAQILRLILG